MMAADKDLVCGERGYIRRKKSGEYVDSSARCLFIPRIKQRLRRWKGLAAPCAQFSHGLLCGVVGYGDLQGKGQAAMMNALLEKHLKIVLGLRGLS
jgi:hypothetical protein